MNTKVDYSNYTNQALYEIAINKKNRMCERYAAARELQKRKSQ
jgi:hypothetical protein